jgi:hypothetical protein
MTYNVSNKGADVGWLKLIVVLCILFSAVSSFAAEPNELSEQDRTIVSRQTAQDWLLVGDLQMKKGLYEQAEKSFLAAKEYENYLAPAERTQIEKNLAEIHQAMIERQPIIEHIKKAKELVSQGQSVKARAHFEKVRKSPYLTEQERKQIDHDIKNVDSSFDNQRMEMTELYNRSVKLYRAGEMEKARDGFVEVARYGLLVTPRGQTAEDYLIQIDSVLTEQLKNTVEVNAVLPSPAKESPKAKPPVTPSTSEVTLLKPQEEKSPAEKQPQPTMTQEEKTEVAKASEPQEEKSPAAEETNNANGDTDKESDKESREKIARAYTKAVVDDAALRIDYYLSTGEFDKALMKIRDATDVVKTNRSLLGDELFTIYSIRLKQLADNLIHARKAL